MRSGSSLAPSVLVQPPARPNTDAVRSCCGCGGAANRSPSVVPAADASAGADPARARTTSGGLLTLLGVLGWLCVPKCPLCLGTYVAIGSGITLTVAQSRTLRQALIALAVGLALVGVSRSARWAARFLRARRLGGTATATSI